ncbi:MAG: hypothetical protein UT24_C0015G0004 [Candidatus Woesebacteria bacterium GW2011_GWB1_39_12]|uniref:Uncharacterized protein n=1 Tax=Candidatus Woesebacteria bacterium GW2011_GWB1_39_12 TaxID=1618574 RepID=A0A0G0MIL9_9BACT|nr:MAG: hypothetical protein UT24_C0015G0004 [Candidatus Woesebacteria bacterium GW2011_GWB1_39_12]
MNKHPTLLIEIKKDQFAEVDIGIVPLIKKMNDDDDITTIFSCEGDLESMLEKESEIDLPYVLFRCESLAKLEKLSKSIFDFNEKNGYETSLQCSWIEDDGLTFCLNFDSKKTLLNYIQFKEK